MKDLRFSVVIPTRDRVETLAYAIRTCLKQDFDSYEVVVSDNGTGPAAQCLVDGFGDERLRYCRTGRTLAMSDSWEFAVSQATGEYVIVIGDDDGLLFHALRDIDRLLRDSREKALRWSSAYYLWPGAVFTDLQHRLSIPLTRELERMTYRNVAPGVVNGRLDPALLPSVYHGAAHRDLISGLRRRSGRVFGGAAPDIYSGFALGYLLGTYLSTSIPMSVAGLSARSNGCAHARDGDRNETVAEFNTLNEVAQLRRHRLAPDVACLPAVVADMFFHARDALFPDDGAIVVDRKGLATNTIRSMIWETGAEWRKGFDAVRRSLADVPRLQRWLDRTFPEPGVCTAYRSMFIPWGFNGGRLVVDASKFGVADVYGAAELCEQIAGLRGHDLGAPLALRPMSPYRRIRTAARVLLKGR